MTGISEKLKHISRRDLFKLAGSYGMSSTLLAAAMFGWWCYNTSVVGAGGRIDLRKALCERSQAYAKECGQLYQQVRFCHQRSRAGDRWKWRLLSAERMEYT